MTAYKLLLILISIVCGLALALPSALFVAGMLALVGVDVQGPLPGLTAMIVTYPFLAILFSVLIAIWSSRRADRGLRLWPVGSLLAFSAVFAVHTCVQPLWTF